MVAVAIYSADAALRPRLEQLFRSELVYTVASVTNDPEAVSQLLEQRRPPTETLERYFRHRLDAGQAKVQFVVRAIAEERVVVGVALADVGGDAVVRSA